MDLAGAEALFPTENFKELFDLAKGWNIPYTIHAGEAAGPESVYKALEFGTKRIGHGIRSLEDEVLVKRLTEEGITLELCPTSNLNTSIFSSYEEYPLRKLMEAGVKVTINTDNMTVSNTTVAAELQHMMEAVQLTEEEILPKTDHTIKTEAGYAATCDKAGKQDYVYCVIEGCPYAKGGAPIGQLAGYEKYKDCNGKVIEALGHGDHNGDDYCDHCGGFLQENEDGTNCNCICHKRHWFMRIIYKILSFFWKLFGISRTCCSAGVHY